jgi:predicted DNA binding protein
MNFLLYAHIRGGEFRRVRLGGVEAWSLYPPRAPNTHIIPATEASILIRIHTTTNTPDALVEGLTDAERDTIAEAHAPHEGRIVRMRRC